MKWAAALGCGVLALPFVVIYLILFVALTGGFLSWVLTGVVWNPLSLDLNRALAAVGIVVFGTLVLPSLIKD